MMANRLDADNQNEIVFQVYDESLQSHESLAWVIADEDFTLLDNPPQCTTTQDTGQNETQIRAQCIDTPIFSIPGSAFSLRFTDGLFVRPDPTRRFLRVAAVGAILLIGSALPSIIERVHPTQVKASPALGATKKANVRILTVMAGRDETVKDISVRYVGHFDDQLLQEIRNLNPSLNDPDHLGDGQLIRIPLRANTSIK
jgi:hypothetical protein